MDDVVRRVYWVYNGDNGRGVTSIVGSIDFPKIHAGFALSCVGFELFEIDSLDGFYNIINHSRCEILSRDWQRHLFQSRDES